MNRIDHQFSYSECHNADKLSDVEGNLIDRAKEIAAQAYAPYSQFNVGAAIQIADQIITGNNQENVAFPSGLCAERTALFYAKSQFPDGKISAIAITSFSDNFEVTTPITPCGSCRQALVEYEVNQGSPIKVILSNYAKNHIQILDSVSDLLPMGFKEKNLKK